jgi:hypothetical protein
MEQSEGILLSVFFDAESGKQIDTKEPHKTNR